MLCRLFAVCFVCITGLLPNSPLRAANPPAVDLSYIPGDALAAYVVYPARTFESPAMQLFPWEALSAKTESEWGFDLADVAEIVGVIDPTVVQLQPAVGTVLRFRRPIAGDRVFAKFAADAPATEILGKKVRRLAPPKNASVCIIDDRTVIIGGEEYLAKMLTAKPDEKSLLHQKLRTADFRANIVGVVVIEPVRAQLKQLAGQVLPGLPPAIADLSKLPDETTAVEIRSYLTPNIRLVALFHATDAAASEAIEGQLTAAANFGKQTAKGFVMQQFARANDPVEKAFGDYVQRMLDSSLDRVTVKRANDRVGLIVDTQVNPSTLGVGAALLLPAVAKTREAAQRAQSMNNLRQLSIAMLNEEANKGRFPARANFKDGKPLLSWRVHLLPYLEEQALYKQFHLDEPWDSEHNKKLLASMPDIYRTPGHDAGVGQTSYLVPVGKNMMFDGEKGVTGDSIIEARSTCLLIALAGNDKAVPWTKPEDLAIDNDKPWACLGTLPFGDMWQAAFVDGSVRNISRNTDDAVLQKMFRRK